MAAGKSRHTEQKDAIIQAMREANDFVSASDLYALLREKGRPIGLATVYRQLNSLAQSGSADTISMGGRQMYRLCDETPKHHHHLVCEGCGKTVEIEPPDGEWMRSIAKENGFTISRHVLEVFGLCSDCQARRGDLRREALAEAKEKARPQRKAETKDRGE
ncbi:peptide ABC transporter substrate-binding protein [Pseudoscardovia radai]|jgi:Fur family ferric uptake transcriptional regulator|uniref:Peptide ABC transporter substrate-binding protein n=1 Tax=Pseudoscardovia radai TaxID=987066 RepID=A0A261ESC9_9BIFI|nr:Fur family transcriptional regulator [Pseudoscardovia radai]OZG49769.1 peptide ABC transporter substrate-binding protein [Pseudoscardovia radai]